MLPSCLKDYKPFRFFDMDEAICMAAICEQIIPADNFGPGATEAGVIYYIDKQLDEIFTWDRDTYRNGLIAIQESSNELHGKNFEELDFDEQTRFLENMESGTIPGNYWENNSAGDLFSLMIRHCMQGFYGPPRHGGNKNYISYRLLNLEYPYIVGQNRYRNN